MLHALIVRGWGVEERKRKVRRKEGGWSNWQMEGDRLTPKQKATAYALLRDLRLIDLRATSDIDNCTLPAFCEGGRPISDNYQHNETASPLYSPLRCRGVLAACIGLSQCASSTETLPSISTGSAAKYCWQHTVLETCITSIRGLKGYDTVNNFLWSLCFIFLKKSMNKGIEKQCTCGHPMLR